MLIDLLMGVAMSIPVAWLAARIGRITVPGATVGVLVAALSYAAFSLAGLAVLGVALVLTLATSRLAIGQAKHGGVTDSRGESRGGANIIANCGVGALGALVELATSEGLAGGLGVTVDLTTIWFVTGIAAGASDTVASGIGQTLGGPPRAFPSGRTVSAGTPGAISLLGTLAGIAAAAAIASPAAVLWLIAWRDIAVVVAACTMASLVESALATTFEARGHIGNNTLNLMNTLAAVALALCLFTMMSGVSR